MIILKKLFEMPVYRLTEEKYNQEMRAYISEKNPGGLLSSNYLKDKYGGEWRYNEIIGFLLFYRYGENKIRCEYWETAAKRKVRTKNKLFIKKSDNYCDELFSTTASSIELATVMKSAVAHCEQQLKGRVLGRQLFDKMVDHIDWIRLFN